MSRQRMPRPGSERARGLRLGVPSCKGDGNGGDVALLVSHDLSLSGAPIALLRAAQALGSSGLRPVLVSPKPGPLAAEAASCGIPVRVMPLGRVAGLAGGSGTSGALGGRVGLVVANTIATAPLVAELNGTDVPVLWWVHDADECYDEATTDLLPAWLFPNVACAGDGPRARASLLRRRPQYVVGELPCPLQHMEGDREASARVRRLLARATTRTTFALVGTVEPRKGQDVLLAAIDLLPEELAARCHFVLVGRARDTRMDAAIRAAARRRPELVTRASRIRYRDQHGLYGAIDCVVCASRDEPMSLVVADACAASVLAICSEDVGMATLLGQRDACLVYHDNNPAELAACIRRVCEGPDGELAGMRSRARALCEEAFAEDVFLARLDALLGEARRFSQAMASAPDATGAEDVLGASLAAVEEVRALSRQMGELHAGLRRRGIRSRSMRALYQAAYRLALHVVLPVRRRMSHVRTGKARVPWA